MKGITISTTTWLVSLITLQTLVAHWNVCHGWTFSVKPNRIIAYDATLPRFEKSAEDYFKVLTIDENSMLIGARNNVYNLSLNTMKENSHIEWMSSEAHKEMCIVKGKNVTDCQNYIRIFARVNEKQIMLCGTNSFKPQCRFYNTTESYQEFDGEALCPYSPWQNNTYIYTGASEFYSATTTGFAGVQQLIYRQRLDSPPNNYGGGFTSQALRTDFRNDILNQASFVNALEYNDYVMFFFREHAIEYQNCGKSMYSRVARVCKSDKGGSHPYSDRFSSYLKTRLNCSMPGDFPFYFDELQATSSVIEGIYGNNRDALVYMVMTTNDNAIDGSAICVYSMDDILKAFDGRFKNQRDVNSIWTAIDDSKLPAQRPGQCVDDSRTLPAATLNFVLKNPLMDGAINPIHNSPMLVHTGHNYKFTSIAIDAQVETRNGRNYDVVFIGTDDGHVLKVINVGAAESSDSNKPVVISEQQVLPRGVRVKELRVSKATQTLIVVSEHQVVSIPLHNCSGYKQCAQCVHLRDPYCVWDNNNRECIFFNKTVMGTNGGVYIESINGENDSMCGDASAITNEAGHKMLTQNHGTVYQMAKQPATSDNGESEDEDYQNHKYAGVAVVQAPSSQNTEYFEPQVQTSSASIVLLFVIAALILGVIVGFGLSKCVPKDGAARSAFPFGAAADNHHRNHLGWQVNPSKQLLQLPTLNNGGKDINLLMNTNSSTINNTNNITSKKDNLELEFSLGNKDRTHECKNSNESLDKDCKSAVISASGTGTLQKVKKTYI